MPTNDFFVEVFGLKGLIVKGLTEIRNGKRGNTQLVPLKSSLAAVFRVSTTILRTRKLHPT
jgi:hypothetical protein